MKKQITLALFAFLFSICAFSQTLQPGSKAWMLAQRNSNPSTQSGNHTLGMVYDSTACGLNYTQASVKLGTKFSPPGVTQPAPFPISGLPFCAQIDKAYLWFVTTGNGIADTVTITNPVGTTLTFPTTVVGQDQDICWGYQGSYTYRADVTSIVNGNGNYVVSGIPTSLSTTSNDADGATLMVIYNDVAATYTGSLHIDDGIISLTGGTTNYNMTGFNSCANSNAGNAFMILADLQNLGTTFDVNNGPSFSVTEDWWNFASQSTLIANGQTTCPFNVNGNGDCYSLAVAGLYSQTTCNTCTAASSILNISTTSITAASCANNGSATVSVTGGSGIYSVNWNTNPLQSGLTASNLAPGNYTVTVTDSTAGACGAITVNIPYTGPVLTTTSTGVNCQSLGSGTVSVTGGTGPYTYAWAPTGGNSASATNLSAGIYTVSVTDNTGCTVSTTDTIPNNTSLVVLTYAVPDSCPSPTGSVYANVSGGQSPYTYLWSPGGQTTSSVNGLTAGSYTVVVTDAAGCVISSMVTVNAITVPLTVSASGYTPVLCGGSSPLNAYSNYANATFAWQPSTYLDNPSLQNPTSTPLSTITYTVTATSVCGVATDVFTVTLNDSNYFNQQICFVSVDTALNKNVIIWERNNSPSGGFYNIYRETVVSGVYSLIGTQPLSQFTTFTDATSNPLAMANRYVISTVDSCGTESDTSYHHRTLFLQVSPSITGGFNLLWTPYEGLPIATYNIYRGPSPGNLSLIAQVAGTIFNYTDAGPPAGPLYYMVEAVHPFGGCNPSMRLDPLNPLSTSGSFSNLGPTNAVGVNENELLANSLLITPNPNNGNFQLAMPLSHAQEISVNVMNDLGQIVYSKKENASAENVTLQMDLSALSKGVYFVQVKTANGIAIKRLVME